MKANPFRARDQNLKFISDWIIKHRELVRARLLQPSCLTLRSRKGMCHYRWRSQVAAVHRPDPDILRNMFIFKGLVEFDRRSS